MNIRDALGDIRLWIIVFFIVRLIGITNPPLEIGHNWRQTTVTMVSRNFLEVDNTIFYPRIDFAGEKSGITGMEFPLLNYMIYLMAELFGYQHWYGRLINLLVSSIGLFYFYKIIRHYFCDKVAFYATIVLAVSIWFQYSRKVMPDTFSASLIIACIFYGSNYLHTTFHKYGNFYLVFYGVLMSLGTLSKLSAGFLLIVFVFLLFDKTIPIKRKAVFSVVSLIALAPTVFWYYNWVPYLVSQYGFWHFFMGKDFIQGFNEVLLNLNEALSKFYNSALKFIGFSIFLFGFFYSIIKGEYRIYFLFISTFIVFSIVIFKGGYTFLQHDYYVIPFVPVMALITGYGLTKIKNTRIALICLLAVSIEGISNQQHDFRIKENNRQLLNLERDLDGLSSRSDLIMINSGNYPTPIYFAHRKGWVNTNEKISDEAFIDSLKLKGLKYIVILKSSFGSDTMLTRYKMVFDNTDYRIYQL